MGIETFGENERARGQQEDALKEGYHFDNLFDQNEDGAGEKINPETGEFIINDSDKDLENSEVMSIDNKGKLKDIKRTLKDEAATKWLRENGFDEEGNEIKPRKAA